MDYIADKRLETARRGCFVRQRKTVQQVVYCGLLYNEWSNQCCAIGFVGS